MSKVPVSDTLPPPVTLTDSEDTIVSGQKRSLLMSKVPVSDTLPPPVTLTDSEDMIF